MPEHLVYSTREHGFVAEASDSVPKVWVGHLIQSDATFGTKPLSSLSPEDAAGEVEGK